MSKSKIKNILNLYIDDVGKKYNKNIKIRPKSESILLRLIRPFVELFNKRFWDGYITTIGATIWVPDSWVSGAAPNLGQLQTIAHEVIHVRQSKKQGTFIHSFLYLFPQSLSILTLLAFLAIPFGPGWLGWLACLLFLSPLPAPFRYLKELEAYRVQLLFSKYVWRSSPKATQQVKESIIRNLSKSFYYFTWPFPRAIQRNLDDMKPIDKEQYQEIISFIKRYGIIRKT